MVRRATGAYDAYLSTKLEDGDLDATKRATLEAYLAHHESDVHQSKRWDLTFYWLKVNGSLRDGGLAMPDEPDAVCPVCENSVLPPPDVQVCEGEQRFHLACFLRYKRQAAPPEPPDSD